MPQVSRHAMRRAALQASPYRRRAPAVVATLVTTVVALTVTVGQAAWGAQRARSAASSGAYTLGATINVTSGATAAAGQGLRDGIQAYFSYVNSHGGINGHLVEFRALDDQDDPTIGISNVKQLTQDHVSGIFLFQSAIAVPAGPLFHETDTPAIVNALPGSMLHPVQREIFAGDAVVSDESVPAVEFGATKISGPGRFAAINLVTPTFASYVSLGEAAAKQRHWPVVKVEQVAGDATSASAQAAAVAAAKPNFVLMALPDPLAISADQTLRQQGYKGLILNYDGISYSTLQRLKDPNFYVVRESPYAGGAVSPGPLFAQFVSAAKRAGLDPNAPFVMNGYEQAWSVGQALKACGYPCSPSQLTTALDNLHNLSTGGLAYSSISYSKTNHGGLHAVKILHWDTATNGLAVVSGLLPIQDN